MKKIIFISGVIIVLLLAITASAQTNIFPATGSAGIGTTSPNASSLLEIKSTTKGVLIPRMTLVQRNAIASPAIGLLIYQTNSTPGFYYYAGAVWKPVTPADTTAYWKKNGTSIYYNGGKVGVGITAPAYKLDVSGDVNLSTGSVLRINKQSVLYDDAPNQNMFAGDNAGVTLNGGYNNTGIGPLSLNKNTNGNYNTALGANSLLLNTSGSSNTGIGEKALSSNTTGYYNAALGSGALNKNSSANNNVAIGYQSLFSNTSNGNNVGIGFQSLYKNTASENVAIGYQSMYSNTSAADNIAVGNQALYNNTTGTGNIAIGSQSLYSNTTAKNNTAIGYQSQHANISGTANTSLGWASLEANSGGAFNTAIGNSAMENSTTGLYNTALGSTSLLSNTAGSSNTAIGEKAMQGNKTGNSNSALGSGALQNNVSGQWNTALGFQSLYSFNASNNTAIGYQALYSDGNSTDNTAIGTQALYHNGAGGVGNQNSFGNVAVGSGAGFNNALGLLNVFVGYQSGYANAGGSYNVFVGHNAGNDNTEGTYNTFIGYQAGEYNVSGNFNTCLGYNAGYNCTGSNNTFLGNYTTTNKAGVSNSTAVGNGTSLVDDAVVALGNAAVDAVESYAQYFVISDGRYKKNIKENVGGLDFINKLRPVSYTLDVTGINKVLGVDNKTVPDSMVANKEKKMYTGFIAQEVEKAANDIGYHFSGLKKPQNDKSFYGLSYADFVVPLVKAVQQLSKSNNDKQAQIDSLNTANQLVSDKLDALTAKVDKMEQAMSQCCSSFSSNMQAAISDNAVSIGIDRSVDKARLEQNVPNPFSGSSSFSYYIPSGFRTAQLIITDMMGKTLKTYTITQSGYGKQTIYNTESASGMYQYSLLIDGKLVATRKMVVSR